MSPTYIKIRYVILTVVNMSDQVQSGILFPIPLGEDRIFRNQAMDDILELLYRNPHEEFGVRQLREVTGHGAQTVDTALTLFGQINIINARREGNRKLISINRERVQKPEDPILEIPQEEFRNPIKLFTDRVRNEQGENLVGILVFGSVARGEADRASDIDLQVIVENNLLQVRRSIQEIRQEIEHERFDGERYELQVMVESVETATQYGEKLKEIFSNGITLYESEQLETVKDGVLDG